MVVVFSVWSQTMSSLFHKREGFGSKARGGAAQPPGERTSGEECSFSRGTEGRKTFLLMWLACALMPDLSCPTLASRSQLTLSFSRLCLSDHGTFMSVSGRLWEQQTPVYEVSLPIDMRVKGKFVYLASVSVWVWMPLLAKNRSPHLRVAVRLWKAVVPT